MKDERMAMSEALYGFLTPTPEYFQQPAQEKKSTQFLRTILKRYVDFYINTSGRFLHKHQ